MRATCIPLTAVALGMLCAPVLGEVGARIALALATGIFGADEVEISRACWAAS